MPVTDPDPDSATTAPDRDAPDSPVRGEALLDDLTEPQRQAVMHVQGPLLVLAGAGSGKTRVITRRIAYMVQHVGLAPWNILAITFTNKAAGEMRQRVASLLTQRQSQAVTVCTFHSLCTRILRQYGSAMGLKAGYSIYDTGDQQKAIKDAVERLGLNTSNFPPARTLATISNAKNELIDHEAFAANAHDWSARNVARIYTQYQEILAKNNALDFDDLLVKTVQLMRRHPDVLAALRQRYQYLLIDEYQDTNHAQFIIANVLASGDSAHQNICATGDPDQSIYSWRGADIRNILEFEEHYPQATTVRLEQNYRSTKNILAVADSLINHNQQRKHKALWTENETGAPVRVVTVVDERHEAQWIVEQLQGMHDREAIEWRDMAVFYRTNSLSRVLEDALRDAALPYQIARGTAFYERLEVRDAIAYLRAIANPVDEVNLLRIINKPTRGISDTTCKTLQAQAVSQGTTVNGVLREPRVLALLNKRAEGSVLKFANLLDGLRKEAGYRDALPAAADHADHDGPPEHRHEMSLRGFVEHVLRESGLHEFYANDKADPDQERLENLGELVSSAQQFEDDYEATHEAEPSEDPTALSLPRKLEAYLEQISLVSDVDSINSSQGAVTLMTLHAAKGLEFPVVALVGLEEGLLPHKRAVESNNTAALEEERRLCFVGITRARRFLSLSRARSRTIFGQTVPTLPSRFLSELPRKGVEKVDASSDEDWITGGSAGSGRGGSGSNRDTDVDCGEETFGIAAGMAVQHRVFGVGRVMTVQGRGSQARAVVHFQRAGIKTLVLEAARLEPE